MKRILAAAFAALTIVGAGCGHPSRTIPQHPAPATTVSPGPTAPERVAFPQPSGKICHPRNPPSMGECVGANFGLTVPKLGALPRATSRSLCADWSVWQDYYPNTTGLRCVIIQASYGLHVEPSVYDQIKDANAHRIPWGAYGFLEGDSGTAEAKLAAAVTNGRGRKLGVWADAEVGAAYPHACSFISEVHTLGVHITGLFAAPGMWPGGRCYGLLWPSEWGVPVYPFAGYPRSSVVIHQFCGTCYRYGVETDLDEDLGLIGLAHSNPPSPQALRADLYADYRLRRTLRVLLSRHNCRSVPLRAKPPVYKHACRVWLVQGGTVGHRILVLHEKGVF